MSYLKVKDNFDLVRDERSSAILNVNQKELNKYKQARDEMLKLKKISDDHNKIKNDIQEIKDLLNILLRQNNV
jgi:conjugal transfer/entry exclusion protein